jgi:small-conductance mechanosensitive channel/CRP-like cAMP-binding protein
MRELRNTGLALVLLAAAALGAAALGGRAAGIVEGIARLLAGFAAVRLATLLVFRHALPAAGARIPRIAEDIALVAGATAWAAIQLSLAGMDLASLVTTSAVITAVLAFAMQDTLGNTLAGLFLELDRSVKIGDWIRLDDLSGRVVDIRWRHTAVRTRAGELAIIPNSALVKSRFHVIGNPELEEVRLRRPVWFEVDYDVPAPRVIAAAEQALAGAEIDAVAREPRPECALVELGGGQARYALRYSLTDPLRDEATDSAVRVHLLAALERSGIALSLPKLVNYQVRETEERQNARRERELEARVAALRGVDLFAALSPAELRALAAHLVHAPFAAGDVITRQGAVAHWLYLLLEGEAEVWVEAAGAPRRRVASLAPGSVFGEMGMMTGEPRRATVVATTATECYRLDKPAFQEILRARPQIAEALSRVLAARAGGLRQALEEAQAAAAAARLQPETLLARIRAFFGIATPPSSPAVSAALRSRS